MKSAHLRFTITQIRILCRKRRKDPIPTSVRLTSVCEYLLREYEKSPNTVIGIAWYMNGMKVLPIQTSCLSVLEIQAIYQQVQLEGGPNENVRRATEILFAQKINPEKFKTPNLHPVKHRT